MKITPDFDAILNDADDDFEASGALDDVLDSVHLSAPVTAAIDEPDETKAAPDDEMPDALPDPLGVTFTDAELDALTETDSEDAIKLALGKASADQRELLTAQTITHE